MSRRDSRDSDSKRHRSRFDREPSPKRSRGDEKDKKVRVTGKNDSESAKQADQDQKQRHRMQDTLPLESPLAALSKEENGVPAKESDKIPSGHIEGTKRSSDPVELPRSRSYSEHHERRNAGQVVRSSRRSSDAERGSWRDSKDRHDGRTVSKTTTNDSRPKNEKPKGDENRTWPHDGFFEMEADRPPARKRPAFRETKIPVESENADKTEVETANPSMEGSRKEERGNKPRYLDRSDRPRFLDRSHKQFGGERAPYRGGQQRGFSPSRERYTGGTGHNHREGDRFSGRQGYNSSGGGGTEKWKHDLYHEANKSPAQKNEEEQIAKVETLLAS